MAKMGRPVKPKNERRRSTSIGLTKAELDALRTIADTEDVSMGVLVGRWAIASLKRLKRNS